jgi:zinc protease
MEMAGISYKLTDRIIEKLAAVTPEQVQAVAKKYFTDDQLTVASLVPLPVDASQKKAPSPAGLRH